MAAQTARRSPNLETFVEDFEGRLVALARTHDVLTAQAWSGAELREVLMSELSVFADRVRLEGPPVRLDATQALAVGLIAHELATNAVKYGALSTPRGHVEVSWSKSHSPREFTIRWVERGGPLVTIPTHRGFGRRLIEKLTAGDLQGALDMRFEPDGLVASLRAPLAAAERTARASSLRRQRAG